MATVTISGTTRPGGRTGSSAPRGAIGAGLLAFVSVFLLVAGAASPATAGGSAAPGEVGAFILDPVLTSASR